MSTTEINKHPQFRYHLDQLGPRSTRVPRRERRAHVPRRINSLVILSLLVFLATSLVSVQANSADLKKVRIGNHNKHTRLVFDLTGATTPSLTRSGAATYELQLPNTRWKATKLHAREGLVRNVTPTPNSAKSSDLRLEVRLSANARASLQTLSSPPRVVLDLAEVPAENEYVVAIDPGHGGRAPGAVGKGGTLEKNVVLGICLQLAKTLNARPGIRAILTRDTDQTLSLTDRVEIARQENADLFVSVHADAITDRRVRGGSVYALSNTGAEHAARRWAGKIPNRAKAKTKLAGVDLSHRDANVANVLYDLVQNDTLQRSNLLAENVLNQMLASQPVRFDKVRLADLGVLKAPDIPSILVETAFISNVQDEARLKSTKGQRSIAKAIAQGITGFIERPSEIARARSGASNEPLIAQTASFRHYSVAPGDTLYSLARRFGTTVKTLAETNRLRNNTIKHGMTLRIPGAAPAIAAGN